jgi:hypothetical protein
MKQITEEQIEAAYNAFWKGIVATSLPWNKQEKEEQNQFRVRIKNAAPHVQDATTAPGAPLTDEEWNPIEQCIRERLMSTPFSAIRDTINAILGKRNVDKPVAAAQPVDGMTAYYRELYQQTLDREKNLQEDMQALSENADFLRRSVGACHMMISRDDIGELEREEWDATSLPARLKNYILANRNVAQLVDDNVLEAVALALYGSSENNWEVTGESTRARYRDEARRGIYVLLDAMRGPVTDEEVHGVDELGRKASIEKIIDRRIARILKPKKQTPVEMVRQFLSSISSIDLRDPAYLDAATMDLLSLVEKLKEHHE